jgi:hypothetical protein
VGGSYDRAVDGAGRAGCARLSQSFLHGYHQRLFCQFRTARPSRWIRRLVRRSGCLVRRKSLSRCCPGRAFLSWPCLQQIPVKLCRNGRLRHLPRVSARRLRDLRSLRQQRHEDLSPIFLWITFGANAIGAGYKRSYHGITVDQDECLVLLQGFWSGQQGDDDTYLLAAQSQDCQ